MIYSEPTNFHGKKWHQLDGHKSNFFELGDPQFDLAVRFRSSISYALPQMRVVLIPKVN